MRSISKLAFLALLTLPAFADPPSITARTWLNSKPVPASALRNKVVLLDFWATWCLPCVYNLPKMQMLADNFSSAPFAVIGVHYQSGSPQIPMYLRDQRVHFPIAVDSGATFTRFGIAQVPTYLLFDKQGSVRFQGNTAPPQGLIEYLLAE